MSHHRKLRNVVAMVSVNASIQCERIKAEIRAMAERDRRSLGQIFRHIGLGKIK